MGPILELSGVKMHLSKGYKTTTVREEKWKVFREKNFEKIVTFVGFFLGI